MLLIRRWYLKQLTIYLMRSRVIPFLELSPLFEINIHELMIHSLTPVINQISNRNQARLIEIIPKASSHYCSIAIVKGITQLLLTLALELLPLREVGYHVRLELYALDADMDYLLYY